MSFNISYTFEANDQFTNVSRAVQSSFTDLSAKANALRGRLNQLSSSFIGLGKQLGLRVTAPIVAFGTLAVKQASNLELMQLKMDAFTGSAEMGQKVMQDLINFTRRSPFELQGVTEASKVLLSVGTNIKDLVPLLNDLGDMSALTNVSLTDFAYLLARTHEQGTVSGRVLKTLYQQGLPLSESFEDLKKKFHITAGSLDEVAKKGLLTYHDLLLILRNVPKHSKAFHDGMKKMSETLAGSMIRLKTNFYLAVAEIGKVIISMKNLKGEVNFLIVELQKFTKAFAPWVEGHKTLVKWIIIIASIAAALSPVLIYLGMMIWAVQMILSPWLLIIAAIALVVAGVVYLLTRFFTMQQIMHGLLIAWKIIVAAFKIAGEVLKIIGYSIYYLFILPIMKLSKLIIDMGKAIYNFLVNPFVELYHLVTKIFALLHPGKKVVIEHQQTIKQGQGLGTISPVAVTAKHQVESHLGISVYDPSRYIKALTGTSTGNMSLDTGTNMLFSRI